MSEARFYQVEMLHLLWAAPVLAALLWHAAARRRAALAALAQPHLLRRVNKDVDGSRRRWKGLLLIVAAGLTAIAAARPAWNPVSREATSSGRDVAFLIDVSRSMLAEDLAPNRLERAKLAILDALDRPRGDRVALVAFAGAASVKCPLTLDYGFFRMALEDLSPESAPLGGTMIGDAVRKTMDEVFDDSAGQYRDIVLITDGEDHESFPVEAAAAAGERGARLIAIGLGDENVGRPIPVVDGSAGRRFLKHDGREVRSRLDADTLRKMAAATPGGRYLNVATSAIDFGEVYSQLIASAERRELDSRGIVRLEEKYQIFLGAAFLLLCGELALSDKRRRR